MGGGVVYAVVTKCDKNSSIITFFAFLFTTTRHRVFCKLLIKNYYNNEINRNEIGNHFIKRIFNSYR